MKKKNPMRSESSVNWAAFQRSGELPVTGIVKEIGWLFCRDIIEGIPVRGRKLSQIIPGGFFLLKSGVIS